MIFFRAGVGASLSDEDNGEVLKCRLHHSVDEYSSRLRVDDLRYLEERPGLYDEFDYVIYNQDFFYCRQHSDDDDSSGGGDSSLGSDEAQSPHHTSMVSTRSCSDLAEHSDSLSAFPSQKSLDHHFPDYSFLTSTPSAPLLPPPPPLPPLLFPSKNNNNNGIPTTTTPATTTTTTTTTPPLSVSATGGGSVRERRRCTTTAVISVLPHYASPQAIELEILLRQKFGDRHGYYPLIGLHSYIPRRVLRGGILDVLFELAMNMVSFMAGKGGECLIDLTNSIFVVKNLNELGYIDDALAKYSRWIAQTQTHATRPQIPFANDVVQYTLQAAEGGTAAGGGVGPMVSLESRRDAGEDDDEEELILSWMDHLVYLAPNGRRDKALYLSALKYILVAP